MAQLDLTQDWQVIDNMEAVTYTSVRTADNVFDIIDSALRRPIRLREKSPSNGVYQGFEVNWLVPVVKLADLLSDGSFPKPRDVLTDSAGTAWTVLTTEKIAFNSWWKLGCVDLVIAVQLFDSLDVQRADTSQDDAAGGVVRSWPDNNAQGVPAGGSTPYQGITCRAQLLTQEEREERGLRGLEAAYAVILSQQITLTPEDRLKVTPADGSGTLYLQVRRQHNPQLITDLPVLDAVLAV